MDSIEKYYDISLNDKDKKNLYTEYKSEYKKIEEEFINKVCLEKKDIPFLFLAISCQLLRIFLLNRLLKIEKAGAGNELEKKLHKVQDKILNKNQIKKDYKKKLYPINSEYYAPIEQIILKPGVPYDVTKAKVTGIFKGANHRFTTLGHDPILGLVFGTANIMTNTITTVKKDSIFPIINSYHVSYESKPKNPYINPIIDNMFDTDLFHSCSTSMIFQKVFERTLEEPEAFVAALIKQIIHIGTDLFTPCGIQIPMANLVLTNSKVEELTKFLSTGDLLKIGTSMTMSVFINFLIAVLHTLMYKSTSEISKELYSIKTRKIILYSNIIATGSNILEVSISKNIENLDIGGLMVTLYRIVSDVSFMTEIKKEFINTKISEKYEEKIKKLDYEIENILKELKYSY